MKIRHKDSDVLIDMSYPRYGNYGKHWMSQYGYLTYNRKQILFIYTKDGESYTVDVTDEYIIIK